MTSGRQTHRPALEAIAAQFDIPPPVGDIEPLGRGLINDTFRVGTDDCAYVLQRINRRVFPDPGQIMINLRLFTQLLSEPDAKALKIPRLVLTHDGDASVRDEHGDLWRMMELVPSAVTLSRIEHPHEGQEVGRILGSFHRIAASLPAERFGIALPGFHATSAYLERLRRVAAERRSPGDDVARLLDQIQARETLASVLEEGVRAGRIPMRITHGDPKLDNILFSQDRTKAVALIDLDTVQPGLVQHDLGDCLRSCCNRQGEASREWDEVRFDTALCSAILTGYASASRGLLGPAEIGGLLDAIRLMPFELALRFLTDHLEGNRYFRTQYPGQNLLKAKVQMALVEDIERQEPRIREVISTAFRPD